MKSEINKINRVYVFSPVKTFNSLQAATVYVHDINFVEHVTVVKMLNCSQTGTSYSTKLHQKNFSLLCKRKPVWHD